MKYIEHISNFWDSFWFPKYDNEKENLGIFRIVFYFFIMVEFSYSTMTHMPTYAEEMFYDPVVFFRIFTPIHQSVEIFNIFKIAFYVFSFLAGIGFATPVTSKLVLLSAFYICAPLQNYGAYQHLGSTFLLPVLIMSLSKCGDAISVDSYLSKYKYYIFKPKSFYSGEYVWTIKLLQVSFCFIFFSSAILKFSAGGGEWLRYNMLGIFLERFDFLYKFNKPNAISEFLRNFIREHYWIGRISTIATICLELSMPLMLVSKKFIKPLLIMAIIFLIGVMVLMGHHFWYTLLPYIVAIIFLQNNFYKLLKKTG